MTPFTFDANSIAMFQSERTRSIVGDAHQAIAAIQSIGCIALDIEGLCFQEWLACAGGKHPIALEDWVTASLNDGYIRMYKLADTKCRKHLLSLGLPSDDHKWVRLAIGCGGNRIVSEDVDFFDPSKKRAPAAIKEKLKANRTGACAKALRKAYNVSVMCIRHVSDEVTDLSKTGGHV